MSKRNAEQRAFDQFGKDAGFEKRSGSWYCHADEVISISNLQKSQYGPLYHFNQGFWLRQLDHERYPKSHLAHIVTRLESLVPDLEQRIGQLLDLDFEMSDEQRIDEIVLLLEERLLPLIKRGSSVPGLRSMADDGTFSHAGIRGPAQEVLGIGR